MTTRLVWITDGRRRARVVDSALGVWASRGWRPVDEPTSTPPSPAPPAPPEGEVEAPLRDAGPSTLDSKGLHLADEE